MDTTPSQSYPTFLWFCKLIQHKVECPQEGVGSCLFICHPCLFLSLKCGLYSTLNTVHVVWYLQSTQHVRFICILHALFPVFGIFLQQCYSATHRPGAATTDLWVFFCSFWVWMKSFLKHFLCLRFIFFLDI